MTEARLSQSSPPPHEPAGPFEKPTEYDAGLLATAIRELADAPAKLRQAVAGLSSAQLDTPYRNWTLRQIVHHLGDSHQHAYCRLKFALTEDNPTIKPYDESRWSELLDARTGDIEPSLRLLEGLHARWTAIAASLTEADWRRGFFHPEANVTIPLWRSFPYYAWHARHHTAQILWRRENMG
jgi:hypothetical protein